MSYLGLILGCTLSKQFGNLQKNAKNSSFLTSKQISVLKEWSIFFQCQLVKKLAKLSLPFCLPKLNSQNVKRKAYISKLGTCKV